jgi:CRISPR-associated protein Csb3
MISNSLEINFDPMNPGQYYACCGLIELFELHGVRTVSRFVCKADRPRLASFLLEANGSLDLTDLLTLLKSAKYQTLEGNETAILPIRVAFSSGISFELDWWLDPFRLQANSLKFWGGQVTSAQLFSKLPKMLPETADTVQLFRYVCATSTRIGVDPRSAWNALDFGSSPNEQGIEAATFPVVEVIAAFGLQGFRPVVENRDRVLYSLWTQPLTRVPARVTAASGLGARCLTARCAIDKRGQGYKYFTFANFILERNEIE